MRNNNLLSNALGSVHFLNIIMTILHSSILNLNKIEMSKFFIVDIYFIFVVTVFFFDWITDGMCFITHIMLSITILTPP